MSTLLGVGLAVLAAAGLAIQTLAVRICSTGRSITEILAVVFAVNLLILIPLPVIAETSGHTLTPLAVAAFGVAGLLGSLLGRVCYYVGIVRLGASRAEPLRSVFPIVAVLTAVVALGETVTTGTLIGLFLLVSGGAAVAMESRASPVTDTGRQFWVDLSFPILAALLYGLDPVVTKLGLSEGAPVLAGLAVRATAAAVGFGVYVTWRIASTAYRPTITFDWIVLLAGVGNTLYLVAYVAALSIAPVSVVAPVLGIGTLFVVVGAAVILQEDEQVTPRIAIGASFIVAGVAMVAHL